MTINLTLAQEILGKSLRNALSVFYTFSKSILGFVGPTALVVISLVIAFALAVPVFKYVIILMFPLY